MNYYDINRKDEFDELFGNLYIGKHPTPERNSYAVLKFDFSGLDISQGKAFRTALGENVQNTVRDFFVRYEHLFNDIEWIIDRLNDSGLHAIDLAVTAAEFADVKIFLFIDEYDYFARELMTMPNLPDEDMETYYTYRFVRNFYEHIESGKHHSAIYRIFVTGVTSATLSDAADLLYLDDLTTDPKFNEMIGFTQDELDGLDIQLNDKRDAEALYRKHAKRRYSGYLFSINAVNSVYNSGLVTNYATEVFNHRHEPELFPEGTIEDYSQLQRLMQKPSNFEAMTKISKDNRTVFAGVDFSYPLGCLDDDRALTPLLFQLGLLTIDKQIGAWYDLKFPNKFARCLFNHYVYGTRTANHPQTVIFLDIDGVLQPYDSQKRFDHIKQIDELYQELYEKYHVDYSEYNMYDVAAVYYDWDKNAIAELKRILEKTGAKIVVSSDWREETVDNMVDFCRIYDLDDYIVGATVKERYKHKYFNEIDEKYRNSGYRAVEILIYLKEHPEIKKYVAIDDIPLIEELGEQHAVVTRSTLTKNDADKCIRLLK
jgi:hypothetical protein